MAHAAVIMATTAVAIVVFLGLAIYVPTRYPQRLISWIFGFLCLTIAVIYLTSFFLAPGSQPSLYVAALILRIRWVAIMIAPVLYFHLTSFYFSPVWRRHQLWLLPLVYLIGAGLAAAIFYTNQVVAGPLPRSEPHIMGVIPGPLMPVLAAFFILLILISLVGLFTSYWRSASPSFRHQLRFLLWPTVLILAGTILHWTIIFTEALGQIHHELPDALLIVAAFFYARSVIKDGSFVGRPISPRELLYGTLTVVFGLTLIYVTLSLDQRLINYTALPFPIATGILVLLVVTGYPAARRWITNYLDMWLFKAEYQQKQLVQQLAGALAEIPWSERLRAELLDSLGAILQVQHGYLALADSDSAAEILLVEATYGGGDLKPGPAILLPPLPFNRPQPVSALPARLQSWPDWQKIELLCPFELDQNVSGLIALGEKRDGTPFNRQELLLTTELFEQLKAITQLFPLQQKRDFYLQTARLQNETLQQLGQDVVKSPRPVLSTSRPEQQVAPVQIRLLGPMQVTCEDRLVPESAWGSEKAKSMLAYLLWKSPAGATRAELSQVLWPERSVGETANVFHVTVHRLRRAVQPVNGGERSQTYIQCEREKYRFNTDLPHWLDTSEFESLIQQNDSVSLRSAVALYRGSYLEDIAWALPPEVESQRRKFEQMYADALRRLIAQTDGREAVVYLEKLLVVEPADELANRALILGYLGHGRSDLAQNQLTRWQNILAELDLEPASEIAELWQMVDKRGTPSK